MPVAISRCSGMARGLPRPAPGKTPLAPAGVEPANRWLPPYPVKGSRAWLKSHGFWGDPGAGVGAAVARAAPVVTLDRPDRQRVHALGAGKRLDALRVGDGGDL